MTEVLEGQVSLFDQESWFGKMSLEPSQAENQKEQTSKLSSRRSSASQSQKLPLCLCLTGGGGRNPAASTLKWESGQLLGAYTMHSFGEFPNEENASRLSQILQDSPPPKYCLSAKACLGILKRADKRGKGLPAELKAALEKQANESSDLED